MSNPKMAYTNHTDVRYWQDKNTALVFKTIVPPDYVECAEWKHFLRRVRLLHNPVKGEVIAEDYDTCLSYLDDPDVVEVDLIDYRYWLMIYTNPDL